MKIQPYQKPFLTRLPLDVKIFGGKTQRIFVTYPEAREMLKTGKWIEPKDGK